MKVDGVKSQQRRAHTLMLSRPVLSDSSPLYGLQAARLLSPWDSPGKNTGVGCHVLLLGIFPTQGSNPHLLQWQADSLSLSPLGSRDQYMALIIIIIVESVSILGFPGGSVINNPPASAGDLGSIPGSGEGNGNPPQYSCLENPLGRGAWWATVRGVAKESD